MQEKVSRLEQFHLKMEKRQRMSRKNSRKREQLADKNCYRFIFMWEFGSRMQWNQIKQLFYYNNRFACKHKLGLLTTSNRTLWKAMGGGNSINCMHSAGFRPPGTWLHRNPQDHQQHSSPACLKSHGMRKFPFRLHAFCRLLTTTSNTTLWKAMGGGNTKSVCMQT
jgi:hypothetical protein